MVVDELGWDRMRSRTSCQHQFWPIFWNGNNSNNQVDVERVEWRLSCIVQALPAKDGSAWMIPLGHSPTFVSFVSFVSGVERFHRFHRTGPSEYIDYGYGYEHDVLQLPVYPCPMPYPYPYPCSISYPYYALHWMCPLLIVQYNAYRPVLRTPYSIQQYTQPRKCVTR